MIGEIFFEIVKELLNKTHSFYDKFLPPSL